MERQETMISSHFNVYLHLISYECHHTMHHTHLFGSNSNFYSRAFWSKARLIMSILANEKKKRKKPKHDIEFERQTRYDPKWVYCANKVTRVKIKWLTNGFIKNDMKLSSWQTLTLIKSVDFATYGCLFLYLEKEKKTPVQNHTVLQFSFNPMKLRKKLQVYFKWLNQGIENYNEIHREFINS